MRVIAGKCKGRPLKAVPGMTTRPTTDKIKESLFNMIGPFFEGGNGLDLFGGSGGLGIEALSRGLDKVIFVDYDRKAVGVIKDNIKTCGFEEKSEVYCNDANRALKALIKRGLQFTHIFLDPPYKHKDLPKLIEVIDIGGLLTEDGVIIAEHEGDLELPSNIGRLRLVRRERYGSTTAISLFKYE
ncbi:16S rRNA (guanine(966)-N(2))-methyltransferase RsmD [Calidifontibacillus erzurumensis]|uniref:16S rRNA (Guanine(966)-N(2))-methyltransferase RsmD n=1 Tax=Calidifontibacillus erzurumensis TaxID=2741433 RepID=A0A8J8GC95_9BACI|nr:16S rRNA (guanine(966)-N(2))-methyltransferase RsmD [Calidifontibacillus erzurumensis]NSL50757.1 16S rRNA (guanine(966)-N(2))-methyltransferase RsmD [Calidifontibacillus erzurumensis]